MDWTSLLPLAVPAAIVACSAVALVCGTLSAQSEAKQASRVGRIEGAVGRVAGDIAQRLRAAQAAGGSAGALVQLQDAAVGAGVGYLQSALPDTIAKAGATGDSLEAMITGEIGKLFVANPAAAAPAAAPAAG